MKKAKILSLALASTLALSSFSAFASSNTKMTQKAVASGLKTFPASNAAASPAAAKARKDTLVLGTGQFNYPYSVAYGESQYDINATMLMYDSLIDNNDAVTAIPNAASWTVSKDNKTYTFKLKKGIKFWDGNEATSTDVAFYFYLLDDPKYDGQQNLDTDGIKGWSDYKKGKTSTITGIKTPDKYTISITLDKVNAAAIWDLGSTPIAEKKYIAPNFKRGDAKKVEAAKKVMGTGAYAFKKYKEGAELDLTANKHYWKGKVKIPNVIFSVVATGQELQALQSGAVDVEDEVTAKQDNFNSAQASKFLTTVMFPRRAYSWLQFQDSNPKFNDYRVRQALTYALNRDGIIPAVSQGYSKVIDVPESTVAWDYTSKGITHYGYDLNKANQLLDAAGWKRGSDGYRAKNGTVLSVDYVDSGTAMSKALAAGMKESYMKIGVKVTIETMDWSTECDKSENNQLECYSMSYSLVNDPHSTQNIFGTTGSQNYVKYSNKELDSLFSKEITQLNFTQRKATWAKIWQILNKELPMTPLSQGTKFVIYNARVHGVHATTYVDYFDKLWTYSLS